MSLTFRFDQTPGAAPLYDCDPNEEALTYDWEKREWTDAKTLSKDDKCYGLNGTGSERSMTLALCEALIKLHEDRAKGLVLMSWYWHDGQPLLSLIFLSKSGLTFETDFPGWLLTRTFDYESLVVGSIMFA
jgi:hypothetical protein